MGYEDGVSPEAGVRVSLETDGDDRLVEESIPSARCREQIGDGVMF